MRAITFACLSFVTASLALEFSDLLTLDKRQDIAPGTPLYECHAHCGKLEPFSGRSLWSESEPDWSLRLGGVIVDAEATGYCTNSTYETDLSDCLECALTQDIWQYYGSSVQSAASACGDNATPSTSSVVSGSASATASAAVTTTASSNAAPETITSSVATSAVATSSAATSAETTSSAASAAVSTTASRQHRPLC